MGMAKYTGYITTSATTWSNDTSSTSNYYVSYDTVELSRDPMPYNKKKKSSKKKQKEFQSELMEWVTKNIGLDSGGYICLLHSPLHTGRNSKLLKDFELLRRVGYSARHASVVDHNAYDPFEGSYISRLFVDGVLEHMPGLMAQALFLKKLISRLHPERSSYVIISTKTREQIREEAKRNNYPKDGKGYLITLPNGEQSRIEGMDRDEILALTAYGRIGSVYKADNLTKLKGSHIILWNRI